MDAKYQPLFTPWKIGNVEIKNRIVQCSMGGTSLFGWLEPNHFDKEAAYFLLNRAQDGVGLILPGMQCVRDQLGIPGRKWLYQNDQMFKQLKEYMVEFHKTGAKLFIQLAAGMGRSMAINGWMTVLAKHDILNKLASPIVDVQYCCASASATPNRWAEDVKSRPLTVAEIHEMVEAFGKTAKRLREAGVDGVEIHAVHEGYLLDQFTMKNWNYRTDQYGGSFENRFRFPGECLTAIREAVGKDYPVLIKVNTNCGGEYKASYAEDILYFCRQFEALGADAIELSGYNWLGLGKKQVPTFYLEQAKAIRQEVKIPLILVGGVRGPETVQAILDAGIEFVSASRPFICQPDFVRHLEQGEDSPCVGCTKCLGNIWAKEGRRCVKHPIPPEFAQA